MVIEENVTAGCSAGVEPSTSGVDTALIAPYNNLLSPEFVQLPRIARTFLPSSQHSCLGYALSSDYLITLSGTHSIVSTPPGFPVWFGVTLRRAFTELGEFSL